MLSSDDVKTQILINQGILDIYLPLLDEDDPKLLKETLWGISNICAGTASQIELLGKRGIVTKILEMADILLIRCENDIIYENVSKFIT